MPSFETKSFGTVSYESGAVVEFPRGLPAFEERRRFLALQFPHTSPLIFLQSLEDSGLCFITLPVLAADPQYHLQMGDEDLTLLGLASGRQPRIGDEVLCVVIISIEPGGPTANLLAPIVVNLKSLQAVQAIATDSAYSHQHPLLPCETAICS